MAPARSRSSHPKGALSGHVLRLGVDLGTGKIQIDGQHLQGVATVDRAEITPICLKDDQTARIEQTAILPETGDVIYGTVDVEEAIAANPALQDKVLELWKLSLHPEFQDLDEVVHVLETLYAQKDRGAVQDFMQEQLKCILRDIRNFYKMNNLNAGKGAAYWDSIPLELQISVPAMWGDDQRGLVRNAAVNAIGEAREGTQPSKVELREEPLCVATVYMLSLVKSKSIKEGECLLLIDCGKGTLDIATVKLIRAPSRKATMQLQRIGPCSGNGAGSHRVNTLAWRWLLSGECEEVRKLDERCAQLGTTRREFLRQFSKEIDRIKKDIHNTRYGFSVTIHSSHGQVGPGLLPRLTIDLPRHLIMSWHRVWTDSATELTEEHLDVQGNEKFRCASLTGGGSLSTIFRKAMKAVLSQAPYNIEISTSTACISPCSQGALLQHYFQLDRLPALANFYLARTEEYEAALHKGIATKQSEYKSGTKVLHERLKRIMRYEHGRFSGGDMVPMIFLVESDKEYGIRIHIDLYYSEEDFKEHSALRDEDGTLRHGIRGYPLVSIDIDDLADRGFTEMRGGRTGKKHFELRTFVQMVGSNDKLDIIVYAMKPDFRYPSEPSGKPFAKEHVLFTTPPKEVWNKSQSHFIRTITGTPTQTSGVKRKAEALNDSSRTTTPRKSRNSGFSYYEGTP